MDSNSAPHERDTLVVAVDPLAASRTDRRLKFRLATMLALVAASAPAIGLYTEVGELYPFEPDAPVVIPLAAIVTGLAIGAWRRMAATLIIAQIGLTCAALLALFEVHGTRLANYWLL